MHEIVIPISRAAEVARVVQLLIRRLCSAKHSFICSQYKDAQSIHLGWDVSIVHEIIDNVSSLVNSKQTWAFVNSCCTV